MILFTASSQILDGIVVVFTPALDVPSFTLVVSSFFYRIFIQCSIICFFNTAVALVYNALAIVSPAPGILAFGQICWACNHACPAIIYVTMNDTIRREFYRLVFRVNVAPKVEDTTSAKSTSKI